MGSIWSMVFDLGFVTGFTYSAKDIVPLMLVAIALVTFTASSLLILPAVGPFLVNMITYFVSYLTPATLIVALRKVYDMFQ